MKKDKNGKEYAFKDCVVCKKPFQNRKTWASRGTWETVKYCSKKCQKMKK